MAGLPDFDTAKPNETDFSKSTDPFRATVYKNPTKDYKPYDLLKLPWVSTGKLDFAPGTDKAYSSTNFLVLGLVLAAVAGPDGKGVAWDHFDQYAFRPEALVSQLLNHSVFAQRGAPDQFVKLSAYDRTSYNGHNASSLPGIEVNKVHGVFGGWTASDIVAPVQDIADLAYDIYGEQSSTSLVTQAEVEMMTNKSQGFYGFATFLLSPFTGMPTDVPAGKVNYGTCWGHLGATYGWNSLVQYTPG
jgi:CubicO group peptidase (beta-lactamase class C family)